MATGQAKRAVEEYPGGSHPSKVPFSADCPVMLEWCQSVQRSFVVVQPTKQRPLAAPYWKPEKKGDEAKPIVLKGEFRRDYWAQARSIIRDGLGEVEACDLPTHTTESTELRAAQMYCTAVVENASQLAQIPRFSEYMETVTKGIKRAGGSAEDLEADSQKN